jgi:hypothetical protein
MKISMISLIILLSLTVTALSSASPDILIQTKVGHDFSSLLINRYKAFCKSLGIKDPFSRRLDKPILLTKSRLNSLLPDGLKDVLNSFGNSLGLNILQTETSVWVHGVSYDVKDLKTNIFVHGQEKDGIVLGADFMAREIRISADKVSLELVIPGPSNTTVFTVDVIRPVVKLDNEGLISSKSLIKIKENKDYLNLEIRDLDFSKLVNNLSESQEKIDLEFERIFIPNVSLKVGNRTVKFSPEKIESLILSYRPVIREILVAQAAEILKSNAFEFSQQLVDNFKIKKDYWISTPVLQAKFSLGNISSSADGKSLQLLMPADFCTTENYKENLENCVAKKASTISPSRLNHNHFKESLAIVQDYLENDDEGLVASLSEDYLNKLMVTTYEAGLWDSALKAANVKLGQNLMKLFLNQKGDTATFIMDVIYEPSNMERIMTGSTLIRFPLAVDISFKIEKKDDIPHISVRLENVDTSDETLISGRDGFVSSVQNIPRFKAKVAKAIRQKISHLAHKDLIELKYPEFKDLGLEKIEFVSDGNGRMNAIMRLEDLLSKKR